MLFFNFMFYMCVVGLIYCLERKMDFEISLYINVDDFKLCIDLRLLFLDIWV